MGVLTLRTEKTKIHVNGTSIRRLFEIIAQSQEWGADQ